MADVTIYDIGDLIRLRGALTDDGGDAVAPDDVTVKVLEPNGTVTTYDMGDLTAGGTGVYTIDFSPTMPGTHYYRFAATGSGQAAEEGSFRVKQTPLATAG